MPLIKDPWCMAVKKGDCDKTLGGNGPHTCTRMKHSKREVHICECGITWSGNAST